MRVQISKPIAGNESFTFECDDVGEPIEEKLKLAYRLMDERNWEMNQRVRAADDSYKALLREDPRAAAVVDSLYRNMFSQRVFYDRATEPTPAE